MSSIPNYTNIVVTLLTEIDLLLKNFVFEGYQAVSSYMARPLAIVSMIYLAIVGYRVMLGQMSLKFNHFIEVVLKFALINLVALHWDWVSENLVALLNGMVSELSDVILKATPLTMPGVDGIDGAMQMVLIEFSKLGSLIFKIGGLTNPCPWFDGILIWLLSYALMGLAVFELAFAKIMVAILIVLLPLMVVACYFKAIASIFSQYIGFLIGSALMQVMVSLSLTLSLSMSYWWASSTTGEQALHIGNYGVLPFIIVMFVCIGLTLKSAQLSYQICAGMAGGINGNAVGLQVATFVSSLGIGSFLSRSSSRKASVRGQSHALNQQLAHGAKRSLAIQSKIRRGQ